MIIRKDIIILGLIIFLGGAVGLIVKDNAKREGEGIRIMKECKATLMFTIENNNVSRVYDCMRRPRGED